MTPRPPAGAPAEHHSLLAADGVRLEATHWAPAADVDPATPALVVAHGFGGSRTRDDNLAVLGWLRPLAPVVALDFRGHGRSGGSTTLGHREVLDLDAAVRWARTLGYPRVATVGFSMGASVVVRHAALHGALDTGPDPAAAQEVVDAVVAVSGPAFWFYRGTAAMRTLHRLVETPVGRAVLKRMGGPRVDVDGWDPAGPQPMSPQEAARGLAPTPLLVVHGDADAFFPVEHAEALVAAYAEGAATLREAGGPPADAQLWIEPGLGHAEAAVSAELLARVVRWCRRAVQDPGQEDRGPTPALGPA